LRRASGRGPGQWKCRARVPRARDPDRDDRAPHARGLGARAADLLRSDAESGLRPQPRGPRVAASVHRSRLGAYDLATANADGEAVRTLASFTNATTRLSARTRGRRGRYRRRLRRRRRRVIAIPARDRSYHRRTAHALTGADGRGTRLDRTACRAPGPPRQTRRSFVRHGTRPVQHTLRRRATASDRALRDGG